MVQAVIGSCLAVSVLLADIAIDAHEIRLAATAGARQPTSSRAVAVAPVG